MISGPTKDSQPAEITIAMRLEACARAAGVRSSGAATGALSGSPDWVIAPSVLLGGGPGIRVNPGSTREVVPRAYAGGHGRHHADADPVRPARGGRGAAAGGRPLPGRAPGRHGPRAGRGPHLRPGRDGPPHSVR